MHVPEPRHASSSTSLQPHSSGWRGSPVALPHHPPVPVIHGACASSTCPGSVPVCL